MNGIIPQIGEISILGIGPCRTRAEKDPILNPHKITLSKS